MSVLYVNVYSDLEGLPRLSALAADRGRTDDDWYGPEARFFREFQHVEMRVNGHWFRPPVGMGSKP